MVSRNEKFQHQSLMREKKKISKQISKNGRRVYQGENGKLLPQICHIQILTMILEHEHKD